MSTCTKCERKVQSLYSHSCPNTKLEILDESIIMQCALCSYWAGQLWDQGVTLEQDKEMHYAIDHPEDAKVLNEKDRWVTR